MEDQMWNRARLTSSSSSSIKFNHVANLSTWYDMYNNYEVVDVDEDLEADYPCPFCSEDFDILRLYCHIEEVHPVEAKKGICPMCGMVVGMDLVDHIAVVHGHIDECETGGTDDGSESNSSTSLLRKQMDERSLKSLLEMPASLDFSSNAAADTLLKSFFGNYPTPEDAECTPSSSKDNCQEEPSNGKTLERAMENLSVDDGNKDEKAQRCRFVHSLLFSTMLDDGL